MKSNKRTSILLVIFLAVFCVSSKIFLDQVYRLPILMYHSIDRVSDKNDRMSVSPDVFERQMKFLRDNKYNVIPLDKAVSYIKEGKRPPAKTISITIDDGYSNNFTNAYPVLKKYNLPATIFVITNLVGKEGFMTWDEIKEMSDSGLIDIESHTKNHHWLQHLDDGTLEDELKGSKDILEHRLGKPVRYLCYPMGNYDERVKRFTKACGYEAAFATKPKRLLRLSYDLYEIKRVRISRSSNNMFVFFLKTSGYHAFSKMFKSENKDIPYTLWQKGS